jgi:hypothetical protein
VQDAATVLLSERDANSYFRTSVKGAGEQSKKPKK